MSSVHCGSLFVKLSEDEMPRAAFTALVDGACVWDMAVIWPVVRCGLYVITVSSITADLRPTLPVELAIQSGTISFPL